MPYSIPADQILPLLPLPEPPSPSPNSTSNSGSGIPSSTGPTTTTPPRLTINTTPPTPTFPSGGGDDDDDAVGSPTTRRGGYLQYSPTTSHYPGRAGHRRSYTYMYPHHLYGDDADEAGAGDTNGRTSTNGMNANPNPNAYAVHSTPLNNNHLPRRRSSVSSSSTSPSAGQTLGTTKANGTSMNGHKKPTFQLGQPDDDGSASSEDENSSSDVSAASENHHSNANANANAPPSTTHPIRSKPHQHPTQQHLTHIPPHTLPRQHPRPLQRQEDEDEEEDRHPGLPPLKLKLKQQREPSFGAVPFPRSSPLHSPVPGAVAAAASAGGVGTRQGGYPFPYTPPSVSKSQSQPPLPQPQPQPQPQTHLRVSSETNTAPSNNTSNTTTTDPTRPTFQRTSSTPLLLLANGRPLRSSLKGSSSSPNIPFPSQSMVPSILWPDLHRKREEGGEAQERDVGEAQGQSGGEQVPEGQGLLEPERQHHVVHQRAASAPSVPSVSISSGASSSSPPVRPPPFSSSSSSSSSSTGTALPHARPHPHHPNPLNHYTHAGTAAPHPKNVHFPSSEEGGLATVRVFNRSARPASLSLGARPAGEETETETEGTGTEGEGWGGRMRWGGWGSGKGHLFPRVGGANVNSKAAEVGDVDVQVDDEKTSYIPRVGAHLGDANVYLESLGFVRDVTSTATRPLTITGTILVRNIAYQKTVAVRFTLDDWHTTNDVLAKHEQSLEALPDGFTRSRSGVRKRVADVVGGGGSASASESALASASTSITPVWDRFRFEIRMSDYEESVRGGRVRGMWIVARYSTDGSSESGDVGGGAGREGKAMEWWDNNAGANYWVGFRCVAGGGRERERRRGMLVSAPPAFSPSGDINAPASQALTSTATKKAYPAPSQISASRSFPVYYSPSSYSPLSGYHRPRTHANVNAPAAEDVKRGEYDEGRTPMQGPQQQAQQRQEEQQHQQYQQRQAALTQSTFSRLSRLNLGRMNYAAPAKATAITSPATSPTTTATPPATGTPTASVPHASSSTSSPSSTNSSNSTSTSVESTPLQTPVQDYEDEEYGHGHNHDGYTSAHDVNVDVLSPDSGSFSTVGGRRHPYMGMENGHPATVFEVEKSGSPTPVLTPRASSSSTTSTVVASTPPFSELGEGGLEVKVTPPPLPSLSSPTNSPSSSSLYWPWGSFGNVEGEGKTTTTTASRPLSPPVAGLLRDIQERSMRGSTGVGGALVPPQRRRRGTQGPQAHQQKSQQQQHKQQPQQPEKEEEEGEADDQQRKTTFNIGGSSSSSNSSASGSMSGSGSSTSSGSDTPSSKSKHADGHHHHHRHRKLAPSSGGIPASPSTATTQTTPAHATASPNSTSTANPMWALRPGSPHPFGSGSGNGTVSSAPKRALAQSSTAATTKQPSITEVEPLTTMTTATQPSPSPPRSPQQTEDAVYQAFVRQWCFAQAPGPTVGSSVSVGRGGAGRNGHSHGHGVGMGAGWASSTPGGSGSSVSGGGSGVSLGGVGVGVVDG